MTTPAPTPSGAGDLASILNDPAYTSLFGAGGLSSYLNNPDFNSLVSSIMSQYMTVMSGISVPSATPTGGGQGSGAATGTQARPGSNTGASTASATSAGAKQSSGAESSSSGAPIGAIVGGVVGGIAALVLLGVLIFCCRRRKGQLTERDFLIDDDQHFHSVEPRVEPFGHMAPPMSQASHDTIPLHAMASKEGAMFSPVSHTGSSPPHTPLEADTKQRFHLLPPRSSVTGSSASSSSIRPTHSHPTPPSSQSWGGDTVVEHAVDAGSLAGQRKEVLPPMYDPNWSGPTR